MEKNIDRLLKDIKKVYGESGALLWMPQAGRFEVVERDGAPIRFPDIPVLN